MHVRSLILITERDSDGEFDDKVLQVLKKCTQLSLKMLLMLYTDSEINLKRIKAKSVQALFSGSFPGNL